MGKNRIMIYGPKNDGTYVVEFRTAAGETLAISSASALSPAGVRSRALRPPRRGGGCWRISEASLDGQCW